MNYNHFKPDPCDTPTLILEKSGIIGLSICIDGNRDFPEASVAVVDQSAKFYIFLG